MKRIIHSIVPAFLLAVSVGQIYAFTNLSMPIVKALGVEGRESAVQFAFSLGIFFLGMGAAFFGRVVEKNIRLSTIVGTILFVSGLMVCSLGVRLKSLALVHVGYGVMLGLGTGIIYISPVKTMMLWFPKAKALASALPIVSFGLGSTVSTLLYNGAFGFRGFQAFGIEQALMLFALVYFVPMSASVFLLKKPSAKAVFLEKKDAFKYRNLLSGRFFAQSWLFMFLNISCGLMLIPLAKNVMGDPAVGYSEATITAVVALCGLFNGGGRFLFAAWSDRMKVRTRILSAILGISLAVVAAVAISPKAVFVTLLAVNACYGAGFSVIPAILADHYGMENLSKIHGAVLSAWGMAGLVGNQVAMFVWERLGLGSAGVFIMIAFLYAANLLNVNLLPKLDSEI